MREVERKFNRNSCRKQLKYDQHKDPMIFSRLGDLALLEIQAHLHRLFRLQLNCWQVLYCNKGPQVHLKKCKI